MNKSLLTALTITIIVLAIGGGTYMYTQRESLFGTGEAPRQEESYEIYTLSPGFVTPEYYAEFQRTKKRCVGRSEPIPEEAGVADAPARAKCYGYLEPASPPASPSCVRGGCSGQLCIEETPGGGPATTCEYRADYACYQTAVCERQSNGSCGWTASAELTSCLSNPPALQ